MTDATFTGRNEIWEFAIDNIFVRPFRGWGYGAFWMTERTMYAGSEQLTWVNTANHAHNAYLDTALTMGLPGLALTLLAFMLMPLRDLQAVAGSPRHRPDDHAVRSAVVPRPRLGSVRDGALQRQQRHLLHVHDGGVRPRLAPRIGRLPDPDD